MSEIPGDLAFSSQNPASFRDWLQRCPIVAILRGVTPGEAPAVVEALWQAGIVIVEVPLNSPSPLDSIRELARRFGERMLVGAGTVRSVEDVDAVADAGGRLMVTPHAAPELVRAAKRRGLFACPGGFTPTEMFALLDAGADAVKLFPAEAGGPATLSAIRAVLPAGTLVLPVGGIAADTMAAWRAAGAAGFGVGSSVFRPGDTPDAVRAKADRLVAALASATR